MNPVFILSGAGMVLAAVVLVYSLVQVHRAKGELVEAQANEIESKDKLVQVLDDRIAILDKLACCGCGHPLGRHDDPDSADGYGCRDCNCQAVHNLVDEVRRDRTIARREEDLREGRSGMEVEDE